MAGESSTTRMRSRGAGHRGRGGQERADARRQLLGRRRLDQVVVGAGVEAALEVGGLAERRADDDRHGAAAAAQRSLSALHTRVAVELRHLDVGDHEIGRALVDELERLGAVEGAEPRRSRPPRGSARCGGGSAPSRRRAGSACGRAWRRRARRAARRRRTARARSSAPTRRASPRSAVVGRDEHGGGVDGRGHGAAASQAVHESWPSSAPTRARHHDGVGRLGAAGGEEGLDVGRRRARRGRRRRAGGARTRAARCRRRGRRRSRVASGGRPMWRSTTRTSSPRVERLGHVLVDAGVEAAHAIEVLALARSP